MTEYIGLDLSMEDGAISVLRDSKRVWRGKCASYPEAIAQTIMQRARELERVIFETGPLSVCFYRALRAQTNSARAYCARVASVHIVDLR